MDPVTASMLVSAGSNLLGSFMDRNSARDAAQPLPTYYQYTQSPEQQAMYNMMLPYAQNMYGGNMPTPNLANISNPSMPTSGWYEGLDENVRAGIEEPYMQGMDMLRNQLTGGGQLGNQRAGMSGAAADVFGDYMSKASPAMAKTAWGMMQPGMLQQQGAQNQAALMGQQQGWQAQMLPYQMLMSMLPQTFSDMLVGHHPTMQQIQPGAAMPPNYQTLLDELEAQQEAQQTPFTGDWGLGI